MPRMLVLIGLPGSGKSTFREVMVQRLWQNHGLEDYAFLSSDDEIERIGKDLGFTYDQVFANEKMRDKAMTAFETKFKQALNQQKFIVIDRTNMSTKSRAKYIQAAREKGYEIDAVDFKRPMNDVQHHEWNRRLERPGKTIPNQVLQDMFIAYDRPTAVEGFKNVIEINTFQKA